ncbi:MAG TPA: histone deacetylase family protein [Hypericibacter adhaerens]|uniref:histone deacetylase family protein n=1 Tax=Hypericibacter adhaerens TaxID=2602016 RepID=UPI002C3390E9|nr:histone deacetylase family protein [Hypericibacter adhaerens]HWA43628.1 histone deacetylase family protein [Hypericibacter adhaerens]
MKTIFTEDHRLQDGKAELIDGKLMPCFEMPRRAEILIARVRDQKLGEVLAPEKFGADPVLRVHKPEFVRFLETAWDEWVAQHGSYDALPLNWIAPGMRRLLPETIDGKLSYFSFDAGTPITAGTWRAAIASAEVAMTGMKLVKGGERGAFSLCRPPGHHAGSDFYGGYCFFNNAAIAAQGFRDGGAARVAILDVDYHHGNGSQEIFYKRDDVLTISIHADPKQEFPFVLGHADERGEGRGEGFHLNLPLRWGAAWAEYGHALDTAMRRLTEFSPDVIVVSLGVDTFEKDPISKFKLKHEDYLRIGEAIAAAGKPTLFIMEGGYAVEELGINAVNVLQGFEAKI